MHPGWIWASNLSYRLLQNYSLCSHCCLIVAQKQKIDNNRLCIIVWKSVYITKYLNVLGFFYSFVYDTSLEMCLNGNVLLWNLRDTCFLFLVISLFVVLFVELYRCIFWAGSICLVEWWWVMPIPRLSRDWSLPFGDLKVLKIALKRITQALHRLLESDLHDLCPPKG